MFATAGADGQAAAYLRADGEDAFVVCLNAGEEPARLELSLPGRDGATLAAVTPDGWAWPAAGTDGEAPVEVRDGRSWVGAAAPRSRHPPPDRPDRTPRMGGFAS